GAIARGLAGLAAVLRNPRPNQSYLRCRGGCGCRRGDPGVSRRGRASLRGTRAAAQMIGSASLRLPSDHLHWVLTILAADLPPDAVVWVFGSRATGRARRYSDLDLAIDAGRPLTLDEL